MNFLDLIQTASSSLLKNKARTFLTIIAIFIGAMTITLTNGIGTGIKSYLNKQIGNLGATNVLQIQLTNKQKFGPGSLNSSPTPYNPKLKFAVSTRGGPPGAKQPLMSTKDIQIIKSIPGINSVKPVRALSPAYMMGTKSKYQLSIQEQFGSTTAALLLGTGVNNHSEQNQMIIPESYVKSLGYSSNKSILGKLITIGIINTLGQQSTIKATITGIEQNALIGGLTAFANTTLAKNIYSTQSFGLPKSSINSFSTVDATFPANLTTAQINTIKNRLSAKGYTGQTIKDRENTLFTVINVIIVVFDMFGAIALLAASFGIVNTLLMSVQERTKEIGLMKALGMSPKKIFTLFSIEAILLGFWGSVLGVSFAAIVGKIVNTIGSHGFLKNFTGLSLLTFPISTMLSVILGIMLIAFLAGTLPAIRASKKDPIEALRYE
jgi:putative ABC transport system permease protein